MYSIYRIRNEVTQQVYIGLSACPEFRWKAHQGSKQNQWIRKSIEQYGVDNFTFKVLRTGIKDKQQALIIEDKYIMMYRCVYPNGFNKKINYAWQLPLIYEYDKKVRKMIGLRRDLRSPFTWIANNAGIPIKKIRKAFSSHQYLLTKAEQQKINKVLNT